MEDERRAGAAVVLVSLGGAVEERRGEGHEGEDPLEGDYLVGRTDGRGGCYSFFIVMRNGGSIFFFVWSGERGGGSFFFFLRIVVWRLFEIMHECLS